MRRGGEKGKGPLKKRKTLGKKIAKQNKSCLKRGETIQIQGMVKRERSPSHVVN